MFIQHQNNKKASGAGFTLPDLPYDYSALEPYIDTETMKIHHDKHHAAYVENLNKVLEGHNDLLKMDISELIANLDKVPPEIRTKVRNNAGGHANHTLFWQIMAPKAAGVSARGSLAEAIKSSFGDFKSFQEKFSQAGLGRFGSGWVWLILDGGALSIVDTPNQDTPAMESKNPILGLDVWEHAYYLKYQNRRPDYIAAWWNVVNWGKVNENFEKAFRKKIN